jgi:hypothetical protein
MQKKASAFNCRRFFLHINFAYFAVKLIFHYFAASNPNKGYY